MEKLNPIRASFPIYDKCVLKFKLHLGRIVEEGVETISEQYHLFDLGVDALQGYSIAHPLASEKVLAWMDGYFRKQRRKAAI
mgnify:FL=1